MWFDAVGFEGRLQVTKCGMVRSVDRYVNNYPSGKRLIKGKELKCSRINLSEIFFVDIFYEGVCNYSMKKVNAANPSKFSSRP